MDQTEKSSVNYNQFRPLYGHRLNRSMDVYFDIQHGRLHSFTRKHKKARYSWISLESQVSVRYIACYFHINFGTLDLIRINLSVLSDNVYILI